MAAWARVGEEGCRGCRGRPKRDAEARRTQKGKMLRGTRGFFEKRRGFLVLWASVRKWPGIGG